ncbi:MAG: protein-tyrosine-phosphatase [Phycisphaerae bacterium]|nr:protein-tyrosine-phosphatase [Phycisphaerae bacterium]
MMADRLLTMLVAIALAVAPGGASSVSLNGEEGRPMQTEGLYTPIARYLEDRVAEFETISTDRRATLEELSRYIGEQRSADQEVRLIFVCTHNSRRSHMAQLWAAAAAEAYGLPLATYSGGTEDTAFNPRAVAAMRRAGFEIQQTTNGRNVVYHARMGPGLLPMTCFSKAYHSPPNPKDGFGAVMVCSDADEACPYVKGATGRFAIPFVDPKASDDTPDESNTYDDRCAQIAREMLYVMSRVKR